MHIGYSPDIIGHQGDVHAYTCHRPGPNGTDPALADTDGDGLGDGDEVLVHNTDPLLP